MTDRVLPSRAKHGTFTDLEVRDVLLAYRKDRLVDRKAIDYEAAGREWVATIPYDVQYEWDDPQSVEIVAGILAAALPDRDV